MKQESQVKNKIQGLTRILRQSDQLECAVICRFKNK